MTLILFSIFLIFGSLQTDVRETPAPHFRDWLAELEASYCPAETTWAIYQGPTADSPEFVGNREIPMKSIYAAYRFESSDEAGLFLNSFETDFTTVLANDRYMGAVTPDSSFGFPNYEDASVAIHFVSQPDMESVQAIELHVFALAIQRGSVVSLSIVYNSYAEGMPDFLWGTTESFAPDWKGSESQLTEAIPAPSDLPKAEDPYTEPINAPGDSQQPAEDTKSAMVTIDTSGSGEQQCDIPSNPDVTQTPTA